MLGRFLSFDSFAGKPIQPISLHRYFYANVDPINMIDPSGKVSLGEISLTNNVQGTLNTIGTPNIIRQVAGRAAQKAGETFENQIFNAIKNCLKPGANIRRVNKADDFRDISGRLAMPDFLLSIGKTFKVLEVKTKLPTGKIPEALDRAAKQLEAALLQKYPTAILSQVKHRSNTLSKRKDEIEKLITSGAGFASFLNGTLAVVSFIGEFVIEECVENTLGF
jgi:hypothetical protein